MSGAFVACPDGAFEDGDGETGGPDSLFVDILIVDVVDAADTPDSAVDTNVDSGADGDAGPPCEGCVGAPCDENADCLSGYCLPGPDGRQCTESCVESCPEGFGCRPISTGGADVAFVCVYDHLAFCLPCDDASDCVDPLNPGAATVCHAEADGSGSFCRTPCDDDGDCPDEAACDDGHCALELGATCECSWWASERGASTACEVRGAEGACGGRRVCDAGGPATLPACDAPAPATERCNGEDDDCDGTTDEGYADLGAACDRDDDADSCARGRWGCGPDGERACLGDETVTEEVCNGQDDDCDGRTDEAFAGDGDPCDSVDADDCTDDEVRCVGGSTTCVDVVAERLELCNGEDDDCDGQTDGDDAGLVLVACDNPLGVCGDVLRPARLCQGGSWEACDAAAYAPAGYEADSELSCDGADNDCDGATDEDFFLTLPDDSVVVGVGMACGTGACGGSITACNAAGDGIACPGLDAARDEICNGQDDDCDGVPERDDPDLVPALCEKNVGVCAGARHAAGSCGGEDGWFLCSDAVYATLSDDYQAGVELTCDGLDNDCDGSSDEDFVVVARDGTIHVGVGKACGVGMCAGGFTVCASGGERAVCSTSSNAQPEVCNGQDDDCDGLTDGADPDLARPLCEEQRGVCGGARKPADLCVSGAWQACGAPEYTAHVPDWGTLEARCDGRDEDCDGRVDDDFEVVTAEGAVVRGAGTACGVGGCAGGVARCGADQVSLVCSSSGSALPEVCDGEDNDCDGRLDAVDPDMARAICSNQAGVCSGARALPGRCVDGAWLECNDADYAAHDAGFEPEAEERCNGRDDDCDGATDDDFALTLPTGVVVTGIDKGCGAGECSGGVTVCLGDETGTWCDSSIATAPEVCDGVDNDCDGLTDGADPSLALVPCVRQRGVCEGAMRPARLCVDGAWQLCDDAAFTAHDPRFDGLVEVRCDGADNDCDGSVDEDFALVGRDGGTINGAGKACGTGACAGGVTACNAGGTGIVCPGEANAAAEVCNGEDDDCDAFTDAADVGAGGLVLAPCEVQDGVCSGARHAQAQCVSGAWQACGDAEYAAHDARFQADAEARCEGLDDDCDGAVDEDFTFVALDGAMVDGAGQACGTGACDGGTTVCDGAGTGLVCDREALARPESCDGQDDDCDGRTDAGDASLVRIACDDQDGVCAGAMRPASACADGQWGPCGAEVYGSHDPTYQAGTERTCDARDNDCDGRTDDDFVFRQKDGVDVQGVGTACGVGLCAGGTLVCNVSGNGVTCPTELLATSETCNSADDDCDGFVDAADATLVRVACERQAGVCSGALKPPELCAGGAWAACGEGVYRQHATTYEHGVELSCDGLDNDCDATGDEDFALTLLDGREVSGVGAPCGTGLCAAGTTRCNVARSDIECSSEGLAVAEQCNDVDDDCDGQTDAADAGLVRVPCAVQDGVCAGAMAQPNRCVGGAWQACGDSDYAAHAATWDGAVEAHCDGLDNDCDTRADEDFTWVEGNGLTLRVGQACGLGACTGGAVKCTSPTAASCTTASLARAEVCEGSDEDCDGQVDDGCDDDGDDYCDKTMAVREVPPPPVCPRGGGDCDDDAGGVYPTAAELCDAIDQDCDAATDEQWVDCHRGSCDASVGGAFATQPPDACTGGVCTPVAAVPCGLYACVGGGSEGDVCASGCGVDGDCAAAAHCDQADGRCKPDQPDGTACVEDSDCTSDHCQNGFCCSGGDCCAAATDCPVSYRQAPACDSAATCAGTRKDAVCAASVCGTSAPIPDDRGCSAATLAIDCPAGVPDRLCTGAADQSAPSCPTTCTSDLECEGAWHCDGTCVPDVVDGGACDEASDCAGGHCQNGFCCATGDCCDVATSCPAAYRQAPVCDAAATCQGHRVDATCVASTCGSTGDLADDRGCGAGVEASGCGLYDSTFCNGADPQVAPACPTTCASDDACDAAAHCDGTCVPDVGDGGQCDEASDCTSGHCQNGFCCSGGDCCAGPTDCPASYRTAPACDTAATCQGTKDVATCVLSVCGTQVDVPDDSGCTTGVVSSNCGPFPSVACAGTPDQNTPPCATACGSDAQCDPDAYCRNGTCVPDEGDGEACQDDAECQGGHCQNGFCCDSGDCCADAGDCPSLVYAEPATCDAQATCQGTRKDPVCESSMCDVGPAIPDDRGCLAGSEANLCGSYPSVFCSGQADQSPPVCANACDGDEDCDPGAYCGGGQCVPDQTAGAGCSATNECASGLTCVDGVCCTTSCEGACRRCDVSGNGTCTLAAAGTDPDAECDGFSCTGYHFGFVGDACYYKDDVTDEEAACGAAGACVTRDQACQAQSQVGTPSGLACDATCQDPVAGTCTGTVPGSCTNLNLGQITCGTGQCFRSVPRCVGGAENTCTPGTPSNELCNTVDDDCDTATDASDPVDLVAWDLQACALQVGVCAGATKPAPLCTDGTWDDCTSAEYEAHDAAFEAGAEVTCDGRDNDCSGVADEDFAMVTIDGQLRTGVGASCGVGRCAGGTTQCRADDTGIECSSAGLAVTEVCNAQDDDCDGTTDTADGTMVREACAKQLGVCAGAMKPDALCLGAAGWGTCSDATYLAHSARYQGASEASCDGYDNDCSGTTDEDFTWTPPGGGAPIAGVNQACGVGACAGGVTVCNGGGNGIVCSTAGAAGQEVCDGVDNDCDGLTDQADGDMVVPDCDNQSGVCAGSKRPLARCQGPAGWASCTAADYALASQPGGAFFTAGAEQKCDARDNDCNGATDEDFTYTQRNGLVVATPGPGQACGVGACANGTTQCKADQTGLECPTEANWSVEICDSIDNDCDGPIDAADTIAAAQIPLCAQQAGVCSGAKNEASDCQGGAWQACNTQDYLRRSAAYQAGAETSCDGLDNDCGNGTDEDFSFVGLNGVTHTTVGASCGTGRCAGGSVACNAAGTGLWCATEVSPGPANEACDAVDNNCNGTNNGLAEIAVFDPCGNQTGECAGSIQRQASDCVGNTWQACTAADYSLTPGKVYEASEQSCDNRDNDCDGITETNESSTLTRPACEKQDGVCVGSTKPSSLCVGGAFGACTDATYSTFSANYSTSDVPDASYRDNNCDSVDGNLSLGTFVSPTGSGTACTKASPCLLATGITQAIATGRPYIFMRQGSYPAVSISDALVHLVGGFNTSWVRASRATSGHDVTIGGATFQGHTASIAVISTTASYIGSAGNPMLILDLIVNAVAATGTVGSGEGASSHGIYLRKVFASVERVQVNQANGAAGTDGTNGTNSAGTGAGGGNGGNADEEYFCCSEGRQGGGGGGSNAACSTGTGGGGGGQSGQRDRDCGCTLGVCTGSCGATAGLAGAPGGSATGADGQPGGGGGTCSQGGDASNGYESHGAPGVAVTVTRGTIASNFWLAASRSDGAGQLGANGGGGGGGGGSGGCDTDTDEVGAGGGGGGAGGCRAAVAGTAGRGGGGSFGVFVYDSTVSVIDSFFSRATGGSGGRGGNGGRGAAGGSAGQGGAADGETGRGGHGGVGGTGGHSGAGAGGAGGASYGIFGYLSTLSSTSGTTYGSGGGGSGGSGGTGTDDLRPSGPDQPNGPSGPAGALGTSFICTNPSGC